MQTKLTIQDLTHLAKLHVVPISVLIEVCYSCNESCLHCFLPDHKKEGLTLDQYNDLFSELVKAGTMFVILTGGDPFTRKDFLEIVRLARKKRLSVTIFTNGTLLNKEIIANLKSLFVNEVHISLYGSDSDTHDSITRLPGSFEKSLDGVRMLLNSGIRVRIKSPLMTTTVKEFDSVKRLAHEMGVNIQFGTTITAKDDGDQSTKNLQITGHNLKKILRDPIVSPSSSEPVHFINDSDCIPCDTVLNGGAIDPQGNVFPCNQMRVKGGNILETPFSEIWKQSPVFENLRSIKLRDLVACSTCELFEFCTRCPGLSLLEDGDLLGCSESAKLVACARKEVGLYPTQRHIFSTLKQPE